VRSSRPTVAGPGSLVLVLASLLVAIAAGSAAAATKVDDSYTLKLVSGTAATDELRVEVPDDQADPDADWRVDVTGDGGGACGAFGLALVDNDGQAGPAVDGARVVDGRLPVAVQLAAADAGGPLEPGDYRCGLHLATGDFSKDVKVRLQVTQARQVAPVTRAPRPPSTTRAAPTTTAPAPTTTTTGAPTTTGDATTTTAAEQVAAPVAAPGGGGGGGSAFGGRGPLLGALLAVAVAMLLLGGGMLATSGRSPSRIAPPPGPPDAGD
jgi:hypothetical protein